MALDRARCEENCGAQEGRDARATPAQADLNAVRKQLEKELGFKLVQRAPERAHRGFTSSAHGTHPFAGAGGGGSGFGSDFGGTTFTAFGGGPGAVGGGYTWDPKDPKNLGMGARALRR